MSDWVVKITDKLMPSNTSQALVVDSDGLFLYDVVKKAFFDKGYTLYFCKTALEARRIFELELRGKSNKSLLVVNFPYTARPDMSCDVVVTQISYKDIFPYFDSLALKGLSYNALCTLNELRPYEILGYTGTIRFLLENLYHIDLHALEASRTKERFLSVFIEVLFHDDIINTALKEFLYNESKIQLAGLGKDIISKEGLLLYIQEAIASVGQGKESPCNLVEPLLIKALGSLLTKKILKPQKIRKKLYEAIDSRLLPFYYIDEHGESITRIESLVSHLASIEQTIQDVPGEWIEVGTILGEAFALALSLHDSAMVDKIATSSESLNVRFQTFIDKYYWQMFSLSGTRQPFVVSRVLEYLRAQPERKKALIVIDGMNTWQWNLISKALVAEGMSIKTSSVFSYLPSITAWSRQALFKGAKPDLSLGTEVEKKVFFEYWINRGYSDSEISYLRFSNSCGLTPNITSNAQIAGVVCTDLDDILHGAILGNAQLFQDTITWINKSGIVELIKELKSKGFRCYITSDHGNIEAHGIGNVPMKSRCLSNSRSKRHIEFTSEEMAISYLVSNPGLNAYRRASVVYLSDTSAFCNDPIVITHGGSHLLEMLVPFGIVE